MLHFIECVNKILPKKQEQDLDKFVEYNPNKIEHALKKYDELTDYVNNLEKSLKDAEGKALVYEDVLMKYEKLVKEEISLFRLQQTNISLLNKNFNENEIFINEIQQQIQTFIKDEKLDDKKQPSFNRLFTRFFHQNELFKMRAQKELCKLKETIDQKYRMVERMHQELVSSDNLSETACMSQQNIHTKQAIGY